MIARPSAAAGRGQSSYRNRARRTVVGFSNSGLHRHSLFRLRLRLYACRNFPIAAFFDAGAHGACFREFLHNELCPAVWARLGNRLVGRGEIAFRVAVTSEENALPFSGHALHEFALFALWARNAERLRTNVFALRVSRAADKFAVTSLPLDERGAALGTLFVQRLVGLARLARSLHQAPGGLAIWVPRAGQERAEAPALDGHFAAAFRTRFRPGAVAGVAAKFRRKIARVIAIRIAVATHEKAVAADAFEEVALRALGAELFSGNPALVGFHFVAGALEGLCKPFVKFADGLFPGQFAVFDFVELFFHPRGKA